MNSKKLIFLYIFLLLAVVAVMVQLRKANLKKQPPVRDYPQIVSSGELNVATGYNSVGYYVSGDSVVGFQYELIQALGDAWGLKVNIFLGNSLDENLKGLLSGKYDMVAQNIPVNTHLRDSFAFTEPITFNKWVLVQRKAAFNDGIEPIRRHLDLAKNPLCSQNSPAIVRLNNLSHEIGDTVYVEQDDTYEAEQLVMMVAAGEIDFTVRRKVGYAHGRTFAGNRYRYRYRIHTTRIVGSTKRFAHFAGQPECVAQPFSGNGKVSANLQHVLCRLVRYPRIFVRSTFAIRRFIQSIFTMR